MFFKNAYGYKKLGTLGQRPSNISSVKYEELASALQDASSIAAALPKFRSYANNFALLQQFYIPRHRWNRPEHGCGAAAKWKRPLPRLGRTTPTPQRFRQRLRRRSTPHYR